MGRIRLPEQNKKLGVRYAVTNDGIELPVIDVTHPAFALALTDAEMRALVEKFDHEMDPLARLPKLARLALLRLFLRGSILAEGIESSKGTFLNGMTTYLLKLGPENLGAAYAKPVDQRIAAALPAVGMRLRLQDMARLLADAIAPRLVAEPRRPLHFLNIAGGPALDSLNALIVLARENPSLFVDRPIAVRVLDRDTDGPAFGMRALAALRSEDGPLAGMDIAFQLVPYDWADVSGLAPVLEEARRAGAVAVGSSEGGLFEYGSDEEIIANLRALANEAAAGFVMVGSVTRDDEAMKKLQLTSRAATRPRGLEVFRALAARAGWSVVHAVQRPFSDQVMVQPSPH